MRLWSRLSQSFRRRRQRKAQLNRADAEGGRLRRFELMEPRRMLSADPLRIGAVFIEEDFGSDLHGDTIEITFTGGAPGSELTRVIIDGDQETPGFGSGDVFFDVDSAGLGADNAFPFTIVSFVTQDPNASVRATVVDGESRLVLDFTGFRAGDKLVFSIDVDEVEDFDPTETDLSIINDGLDPITSGVEFQGSRFTAHFAAPQYFEIEGTAEFRNRYDSLLAGTGLDLPLDDQHGKRDRTDGVVVNLVQVPRPVSISGYVFHDRSDDGRRDAGEEGLANVQLQVIPVSTIAPQQTVSVVTGADGFYRAEGLMPGTYHVVEVQQPSGYLDGLDTVGTVGGQLRGTVVNPGDRISQIALSGGEDGVEYNFGEVAPASLRGRVHLSDGDGDCFSSHVHHPPLQGVTVLLRDASGKEIASTITDAAGEYMFQNLRPGTYQILERTPPGLLDGGERVGTVDGRTRGQRTADDLVTAITLGAGEAGVDYDFCEHQPASLSGYVFHDVNNNAVFDPGEEPIGGVLLTLRDAQGRTAGTQRTAANGYYEFLNLHAGIYSLTETQPEGWLDGQDSAGSIAGRRVGAAVHPGDRIDQIQLRYGDHATHYDFGELRPARVSGFVYHDRNNNGLRESSEEGLAGVEVRLVPIQTLTPQQALTLRTGSDGSYDSGLIAPGQYRLLEEQPGGYFDGLDSAGMVAGRRRGVAHNPGDELSGLTLGSGERGVEYNFGELAPAALEGRVHLADGDNDCFSEHAVHPPLAGVTVRLLDAGGKVLQETRTDAQGNYRFENLHPATYGILELTPGGLLDGGERVGTVAASPRGVLAGNDRIERITLGSGERGINYDFCEHSPASLAGYVYHDINHNAVFEANEQPIAGVTLVLRDAAGGELARQVTDANGYYAFRNLAAGTYTIDEIQPAGWLDGLDAPGNIAGKRVGTAATSGDRISAIELKYGDDGVHYDFGELLPARLSGFVYHDRNNNGLREPGEEGLPGVQVQVIPLTSLTPQSPVILTTVQSGFYATGAIAPGLYRVLEVMQPNGYFDGSDAAGNVRGQQRGLARNPGDQIDSVRLGSGEEGIEFNFGELLPSSLRGRVHLSDRDGNCEGHESVLTGVAGAEVELRNARGELVARTTTDAHGNYSFEELKPGTYTLIERTPAGLLDGSEHVGHINGLTVGVLGPNDTIADIVLQAGQQGQHYDFCEYAPSSISGLVYHDRDNDGLHDEGEEPLSGVALWLLDPQGQVLQQTVSDRNGSYSFSGLAKGEYAIREMQPTGWLDGLDSAGTIAGSRVGQAVNPGDLLTQITLGYGENGIDYNFGELRPARIAGVVHSDPDRDCRVDPGEELLGGVTIELLDAQGSIAQQTTTDSSGRYQFENLLPGTYTVRERQPDGYFHGGQRVGSGGGDASQADRLRVAVASGDLLTDYNFCELPPSQLSGYVFQDGETIISPSGTLPGELRTLRDGRRTSDDAPIGGVVLELRDGLSGEAIHSSETLPGHYADGAVRVVTDGSGFYEFRGLRGGRSYAVYEVHPEAYHDGIDTPGSTSGLAINPGENVPQFILSRLTVNPRNDAIILIPLGIGQESRENNFSEVRVEQPQVPPELPPKLPPPDPPVLVLPPLVPTLQLPAPPVTSAASIPVFGSGGGGVTWHLSVINGGTPRGRESADEVSVTVWHQTTYLAHTSWESERLRETQWVLPASEDDDDEDDAWVIMFGIRGGLPVVGDFNGDGFDEIGIFYEGEWFLDLNRNGRWDEEDLWAKLGRTSDRPVTGDWDGDGKDDIGIFGSEWPLDERAIRAEPGLPDAANMHRVQPKNVPPLSEEATEGHRLLRLNANGPRRADVIDHVFRFGEARDIPLAGDFNGDGVHSIGIFRDGQWRIDADGDGKLTDRDPVFQFGQAGDLPVVGDFDSNGVDEIGVFRGGTWYIDANRNQELDAHDRVFQMGGPGDLPVVGDFNGDGADQPAVYRDAG